MKSSTVSIIDMRVKFFWLALLSALMIFEAGSAFAGEETITKSKAPDAVLIVSISNVEPGVGFSRFSILGVDIPRAVSLKQKQLLGILWSTTYYPGILNDTVELCYYRPYSSERSCVPIQPNSSGEVMYFNDQPFDRGSVVEIRHHVLGGERPYARPAGIDSVTFRYRYQ
ncbi:hypothetical protein DYL59_13865 [Pseudomonas kairouanensis]|uniref:Uncharacterized protein n=1 Tax=Pseudomonas kairouanensis TaxID=2293832 RepID=A0A4Z0ARH5_9PSED|nr:hypothetical protein [Pseudomonas kairouanensis]TFY88980.1 hypothetical protein DYL59_13865 [Pseudomonas kairouanensis]